MLMRMFFCFFSFLLIVHVCVCAQYDGTCWQLEDSALRLLLGPDYDKCSEGFYTKSGFRQLMEQAHERVKNEGKTPEQIVFLMRVPFNQYLEKDGIEGSWLATSQDLEDLARDFFPGDERMQAHSVLHMMVYYTFCRQNVQRMQESIFARSQKPTKDSDYGEAYFSLDTELLSAPVAVVGRKLLYFFQDNWDVPLLDFFAAMERDRHIAVMWNNWDNIPNYVKRSGSLFQLCSAVRCDLVQASNVRTFEVVMESIDKHFRMHRNVAIVRVLENLWEEQGPYALVGLFFIFQEMYGYNTGLSLRVLFSKQSLFQKVEDILMQESQKQAFGWKMAELIKAIHPDRRKQGFRCSDVICQVSVDAVKAFMVEYKQIVMNSVVFPQAVVEDEWANLGIDTRLFLPHMMQRVCNYVQGENAVSLARIFDYSGYLPLVQEGVMPMEVWVREGLPIIFIPTHNLLDSWSPRKKQQIIDFFVLRNKYMVCADFIHNVGWYGVRTDAVLEELSSEVKADIFGKEANLQVFKTKNEVLQLLRKETSQDSLINLADAQQIITSSLLIRNGKQCAENHALYLRLVECCDGSEDLASLCMIILYDAYVRANSQEGDLLAAVFDNKELPAKEVIQSYEIEQGKPLVNQLMQWKEDLGKYAFVEDKPSLFRRFAMRSMHKYPLVFKDTLRAGYVSVYDQCAHIHQRLIAEASWRYDGVKGILQDVTRDAELKLVQCWEDIGIFYLMGLELIFDSITAQNSTIKPLYKQDQEYRLLVCIEAFKPKETTLLQALYDGRRKLLGRNFESFYKKIMYAAAYPTLRAKCMLPDGWGLL